MSLGVASLKRLRECDPALQRYVREAEIEIDRGVLAPYVLDITVLCGWRGEAEQRAAFRANPPTSKLDWPDSKHNAMALVNGVWVPRSRAVDVVPYPVEWKDDRQELVLRGYMLGLAARMGIRIRTISWDLPHFELAD